MDNIGEIFMYVEPGLKQFYVASESGWHTMPGSRFYVSQETAGGRLQEPFALLFETEKDAEEVGLIVMPERSGTPFTMPYYVDRKGLMETGEGLAEVAEKVIGMVLDDVGGSLQRLQEDIEARRQEIVERLGPME